jgi:DNA-binding CsgD family transcriptional regulator
MDIAMKSTSLVDAMKYKRLPKANSISELKEIIHIEIRNLGFTDYALVWLDAIDDPASRQLNSYPSELEAKYLNRMYYKHDYILEQAKISLAPSSSNAVHSFLQLAPFATESTEMMNRIFQLHNSYGYYDHHNIPIKSERNAGNTVLSVTIGRPLPLAFEALNVLANRDYTVAQVADELNITAATAGKHLEAVRRSLGVRTNHKAIKIAIQNELIRYEKPQNDMRACLC